MTGTFESVELAIEAAEALLPGTAAPDDAAEDPRWQALIEISRFIASDPAPIWEFIQRWGSSPDEDLSDAIATCLLEHLLERYFEVYFPQVEAHVRAYPRFARTVWMCWQPEGLGSQPENLQRFKALKREVLGGKR
jgi:hypothetical protein